VQENKKELTSTSGKLVG